MVTIKGVRLDTISLSRDNATGDVKLTGNYSLISSLDKVLATQSINGYQGAELKLSGPTVELQNKFIAAVKAELDQVLGLTAVESSAV